MSAPYSVMMIGLLSPAQAGQLGLPGGLGGVEVPGLHVPAVVAVQHQHVGELRDPALPVRGEHHVDESDRAGRVGLPGHVEEGPEVALGRLGLRLGLVGDAPQHDAGVVLVAGDQVPDGLGVHLLRLVVGGLRGERGVALAAEDPATESHVQPHRGGLVDQHDALPVGVVQHVLGVRVVRGPEGVGADPAQQLEVVQQVGVVVALADHRDVLVLAEPGEVERFVR